MPRGLAAARGRRVQFWADIVLRDAEGAADVPVDVVRAVPEDATALVWGYEAGHGWARRARVRT